MSRSQTTPRRGPPTPRARRAADDPGRRRLPLLLRRAWYGLNQAFRRRISHLGITPDQYTVLRTLREGDRRGLTQRALTDLMSSDPNTVASLLERMEGAGLLARGPHEQDGRAHRILLLPAGRRKFQAARRVARVLQPEVLARLPDAQREGFLAQLEQVAEACREAAEHRTAKGTRA
jgi:DNA-binding MarR family transcriptional regulator